MKRNQRFAAVAIAGLVGLVGAACGTAADRSGGVAANGSPTGVDGSKLGKDGAPDDPSTLTQGKGGRFIEWAPPPNLASLVTYSHAAVVGRVTAMGEARWNTKTGAPDPDMGLQFRDATISVEKAVYDSEQLRVTVGGSLQVRLMGDGTNTGPGLEVPGGVVTHYNAISGPVAVGDRVLWVLGMAQFPINDREKTVAVEPIPRLVADFFGAWTVDGASDTARSLLPIRTVPFSALLAKLKLERAAPSPTGSGTKGQLNPLE
jgi:hypothetical protein